MHATRLDTKVTTVLSGITRRNAVYGEHCMNGDARYPLAALCEPHCTGSETHRPPVAARGVRHVQAAAAHLRAQATAPTTRLQPPPAGRGTYRQPPPADGWRHARRSPASASLPPAAPPAAVAPTARPYRSRANKSAYVSRRVTVRAMPSFTKTMAGRGWPLYVLDMV